ncbi:MULTISPECIES: ABC transporter permease [Caldilinea]|jgi:peptide/nickel transport system permease protein|uniref:Putative ABC transporter permease protein n=1 Tax=Caldilinea aerophila (strain DSM 14535 / JCM 11387 / NBRC 104270 / STL-6-O1) TaxID=926550 RepID=I0I257_CALAS|nr:MULTISPECIES: ABC transporter permease [Caldilinea]MBO9392788.1 ABC transporter permease [Caldilinea sp.]BAL99344.1 putative ABC transporter permease protein [Caldilinea aerophila DSM 14535 = NBRC 104270]
MMRFILRRLGGLIFVLFGVSVMTFFLAQIVPADPVAAALGTNAREAQIEAYRRQLGLDQPIVVQYIRYTGRLLQGDLGASIRTRRPVADDLRDFLPATVELTIAAMLVTILVGIPLGIVAALKRNTWIDAAARILALIGGAMPIFYVGLLLLGVFYRQLRWLPGPGRLDSTLQPPTTLTGLYTVDALLTGNWPVFSDALAHLVLPAITLGLYSTAVLLRMTRSSMLEILGQDFVRTARAKGLSQRLVIGRHVFKNALPPILTIIGVIFGSLLSGAVLTETIFNWPGIGRYATTSVTTLDYPAVMGVALVAAVIYPLVNTLVDIGYTLIDPRVRTN